VLTQFGFSYTLCAGKLLQNDPWMLRQYYLDNNQSSCTASPYELIHKPGVLAVIAFDQPCIEPDIPGVIALGIPSLSGKAYEVIEYLDQVAERGVEDGCHWSKIDDVFCAAAWLDPHACTDIETATDDAYTRLFRVITAAGFPHPFRIWNLIPHINVGDGDLEEYKKFCAGRLRAFTHFPESQQQFPAASAIGIQPSATAPQGAVIYLLATRTPGQAFENPRQQPAYQYPRQYGPSSPSFARATRVQLQSEQMIFISGTASIIGHNTQAHGNLAQQLDITIANIRCLLESIDAESAPPTAVRVYLRHQSDMAETRTYLLQHFSEHAINIVCADICRDNLLVEIECMAIAKTIK